MSTERINQVGECCGVFMGALSRHSPSDTTSSSRSVSASPTSLFARTQDSERVVSPTREIVANLREDRDALSLITSFIDSGRW